MKLSKKILWLFGSAVASTFFMVVLYITSERELVIENPFQRRFLGASAELVSQINMHTTSLYFAGTDGEKIYIGDARAPLEIFSLDTLLGNLEKHTISLENENFPFSRIQIKVATPYFYLYDGTAPVIFRGKLSDWEAKIVLDDGRSYFTHGEPMGSNSLAFKTYYQEPSETNIGKFEFGKDTATTSLSANILRKQFDGLFDMDGIMKYDEVSGRLVYLYYYRNEFSVMDSSLRLLNRGHTIDTNTVAKLKVSYNEKTGARQLASSVKTINRLMAVDGNLMLVNSNAIGKFEDKSMWKKAHIVDVYDIKKTRYQYSFYIHYYKTFKMTDMLLTRTHLYVLVGTQVQKYRIKGPNV